MGAWGIQGLPLCPASRQIEYSPLMASKSMQPSHEPPMQAQGLFKVTVGSGQRDKGLMAGGSHSPEHAKVLRHPIGQEQHNK